MPGRRYGRGRARRVSRRPIGMSEIDRRSCALFAQLRRLDRSLADDAAPRTPSPTTAAAARPGRLRRRCPAHRSRARVPPPPRSPARVVGRVVIPPDAAVAPRARPGATGRTGRPTGPSTRHGAGDGGTDRAGPEDDARAPGEPGTDDESPNAGPGWSSPATQPTRRRLRAPTPTPHARRPRRELAGPPPPVTRREPPSYPRGSPRPPPRRPTHFLVAITAGARLPGGGRPRRRRRLAGVEIGVPRRLGGRREGRGGRRRRVRVAATAATAHGRRFAATACSGHGRPSRHRVQWPRPHSPPSRAVAAAAIRRHRVHWPRFASRHGIHGRRLAGCQARLARRCRLRPRDGLVLAARTFDDHARRHARRRTRDRGRGPPAPADGGPAGPAPRQPGQQTATRARPHSPAIPRGRRRLRPRRPRRRRRAAADRQGSAPGPPA